MRYLAAFALWCLAALSSAQAFTILSYDTDIKLEPNGTLQIMENIAVRFNEQRHGIFRFIPTALDNGKGSTRAIFISDISCTNQDGTRDRFDVSADDGDIKIKIGHPDRYEPVGVDRSYVIRYRVKNAISWQGADDSWQPSAELYWNVTGDRWEVDIQRASVRISFPTVSGNSDVRARIFTGPYGSTNSQTMDSVGPRKSDTEAHTWMALSKNNLAAGTDQPLEVGEGMTIVLSLPEDKIAKPSIIQQATWFLIPNLGFGIPIAALLLAIFSFSRVGKDPAAGPMVVQFDPPDDLSGPECGALIDERVDQRDIAAGIVSLAVKGYLTIEASETGFILKRATADLILTGKADGPDLTLFERALLSKLKDCGDRITEADLQKEVAPHIMALKNSLYESLVTHGYYPRNPNTVRTVFAIAGFIVLFGLGIIATSLSYGNPIPAIVGCVFSVPMLIWATMQAPRRTKMGALTWSKVRGFQDFMRRARAPELEWLSKHHPDQATFEQFLPHAISFGLVDQWADAFKGIDLQAPTWYASPHHGYFNPRLFASDMGSISRSVGTAASTPPRSSGASGGGSGFSSGGGFSGGGMGGGGGGSW